VPRVRRRGTPIIIGDVHDLRICRVFGRELDDQAPQRGSWAGSCAASSTRAVVLLGDELAVPTQDRIGRHEAAELVQDAAAERSALRRKPAALGVGELQATIAELLTQRGLDDERISNGRAPMSASDKLGTELGDARTRSPWPVTARCYWTGAIRRYSPRMTAQPGGMLGYWCEWPPRQYLGYPDPAALVARAWEQDRRERIVDYLRAGKTLAAYAGYSSCRFADCRHSLRDRLGTTDMTDGRWIWPEGLWHYVRDHAVRLPDEFVADAAAHGFTVSSDLADRGIEADPAFWLRWSAEHTAAPAATLDACSLDDARAVATELSTQRWTAAVVAELGRWKLALATERAMLVDYTGPISAYALREHLFAHRLPDDEKLLTPERAVAIAEEYASGDRRTRPFAGNTDTDGRRWWAIVSSGPAPTKRLEDIDLRAQQIPGPGWVAYLPDDWRIEVMSAMDEQAWRFFVERWRRKTVTSPLQGCEASPLAAPSGVG
jgi:hypothetical protein